MRIFTINIGVMQQPNNIISTGLDLQYTVDTHTNSQVVQIPLKQWETFEEMFLRYKKYYELSEELTSSFTKIQEIRASRIKRVTLKDV